MRSMLEDILVSAREQRWREYENYGGEKGLEEETESESNRWEGRGGGGGEFNGYRGRSG